MSGYVMLKKPKLSRLYASLVASTLFGVPVLANEMLRKDHENPPTTKILPMGNNTERKRVQDQGDSAFVISSDGQRLVDSPDGVYVPGQVLPGELRQIDAERQTDMSLEKIEIQVKYDGLGVQPALNLRVAEPQGVYSGGETITFVPTSNYPDFIERAEIRILKGHPDTGLQPVLVETLAVHIDQPLQWQVPKAEDKSTFYQYVLRVYDDEDRYDETEPLVLTTNPMAAGREGTLVFNAIGTGEDRTALRNILINGGSVTVYGKNVPAGHRVQVMKQTVPIDPQQRFVIQRILPVGDHVIDVAVVDEQGKPDASFLRDINIPDNEWFYVGLVDITVGKRFGDAGIEDIRPGEYDSVYKKGRQAFYLKGKVKGEYLITAAADTDEEDLRDLFSNMGKKNARDILKNLNPDDYYPVYGDDSTMIEDAPTRGKFYVRVEKGDSQVLWGNYETRIGGTELLRTSRSSYGANLAYKSRELTSFGERVTEATLYAAQADTMSQVDEFLGTGGSAYFLKRQNVLRGSEVVSIETRDQVTGRVIGRRYLVEGEDYRFNNLQGVVILSRPLSSTTGSDAPVRDGALGGNRNYLIVQYEYEPLVGDFGDYNYGGRVQHWSNDKVRLGVTAMDERNGDDSHRASGVDVRYRVGENSFIEAEVARSKGQANTISKSFDGGLSTSDQGLLNKRVGHANAYRFETQLDLKEMEVTERAATLRGYFEQRDAGFASQTNVTNEKTTLWGVSYPIQLTLETKLNLSYDHFEDAADRKKSEGSAYLTHQLDEKTSLSYGVEYMDINQPQAIRAGKRGYDGERTDLGVRVTHSPDAEHTYYVFGQGTVHRSGTVERNNRLGTGASVSINDTVGVRGEVSYGNRGWGGLAGLTYDPDANSHYYVGYELNPDREYDLSNYRELSGRDMGNIVAGARRRTSEKMTVFVENSYDLFGERRSLAQTYGVSYTPSDVSTVIGGLEWGRIQDDTIDPVTGVERSNFRRFAPSLEYIYKDVETGVTGRVRGEVRVERSDDGSRSQNTWLLASALSWKVDQNWRTFIGFDGVYSDTKGSTMSYSDTKYAEATVGYAYRPVDNSRLSALFKYNWLYDMPGNNQVTSGGRFDTYAPAQRIHILSADANYRLYPWLTVGGKYGVRLGDVKYRLQNERQVFEDDWQSSSAHLVVLRADLHLVKEWDFLFEARRLWMPSADTADTGYLLAAYRHLGKNVKIGLGYNFGRFSDDLRYMYLNDRGVFVNMVGKF